MTSIETKKNQIKERKSGRKNELRPFFLFDNRLRLTCAGTRRDLERQAIELREGLALTLYTDDATDDGQSDELLADGVVHFNEPEQCWVAAIDWRAIRHASAETKRRQAIG